ncbi:hypothetical protein AUC68_09610 [Methyloceanibacter methanicus]|uniref:DUF2971 domain-containing protein n=1 Tax=Methyloceanibacter methanicus TaxID=1774968 RepID=A0A1E3VYM4_9HYPH|nr:DUF2971 domain-containing protein [Methyloceanibacter methanicus]ODR98644.1 hypothetical protein AUC68_09610 [Methyloceanibacter methanicus]
MEKWKCQLIRKKFHYSMRRVDVETGFRIKNSHIPQALYKYRTFDTKHTDALAKGELWWVAPELFNDPYDSFATFDTDRFLVEDMSIDEALTQVEALKQASEAEESFVPKKIDRPIQHRAWVDKIHTELFNDERLEVRNALLRSISAFREQMNEEMVRSLSRQSREGLSVLSLCENPTSALMWSHYSDNHKGFCIAYDFSALSPKDLRRRLCFPVFYRKKLVDITRYMARGDLQDFNNYFGTYLCLLKSNEWKYEREWRIVYPLGPSEATRPLEMPKPSAIILGAHVEPANQAWMTSFCAEREIALRQVIQRHDQFRFEIGEVGEVRPEPFVGSKRS